MLVKGWKESQQGRICEIMFLYQSLAINTMLTSPFSGGQRIYKEIFFDISFSTGKKKKWDLEELSAHWQIIFKENVTSSLKWEKNSRLFTSQGIRLK